MNKWNEIRNISQVLSSPMPLVLVKWNAVFRLLDTRELKAVQEIGEIATKTAH